MKDNGILENIKMECGRYFHRIGGFRRDFSGMARDCGPDGLLFASGGFAAGGIQLSFELSQRAQTESAVGNGFGNRSGAGIGGAFGSSQGGSDHWADPNGHGSGVCHKRRGKTAAVVGAEAGAISRLGHCDVLCNFNHWLWRAVVVQSFFCRDDDGSDFGNRAYGQRRYGHYNHDECFPADSEGHAARSQLVQKGFFLKKRAVRRSFFNWNQKRMHARLSSPKMGFVERTVFFAVMQKMHRKNAP